MRDVWLHVQQDIEANRGAIKCVHSAAHYVLKVPFPYVVFSWQWQQLQQQLRTSSNAKVQTQAKSAVGQVELSTTQVNKFQRIMMHVLRHANQDIEIIIGQFQGREIILRMFGPVGQDYRYEQEELSQDQKWRNGKIGGTLIGDGGSQFGMHNKYIIYIQCVCVCVIQMNLSHLD